MYHHQRKGDARAGSAKPQAAPPAAPDHPHRQKAPPKGSGGAGTSPRSRSTGVSKRVTARRWAARRKEWVTAPKAGENAPVEAVGPAPAGGESVGGDSEVAQSE